MAAEVEKGISIWVSSVCVEENCGLPPLIVVSKSGESFRAPWVKYCTLHRRSASPERQRSSGFHRFFEAFEAKVSKKLNMAESHSWWWDSHISPKSSKWMAECLEEMDRSVKRMLQLIEGDGDSFAKKADMYYQKRPELIFHVEDFYRMYRSLAERYDHLTGELRKNIPMELQSQNFGISDVRSEQVSPITTPNRKPNRCRNTHRAAGFDFFLGSRRGSCNDLTQKDGKQSLSVLSDVDSDDDDDASSVNNYSDPPVNGQDEGLQQRVIELEKELRDATEKIAGYEDQLRIANGKLKLAEEEIASLKRELGDNESMKLIAYNFHALLELAQKDIQVAEIAGYEEQLRFAEEEIARLKREIGDYESMKLAYNSHAQLELDQKDIQEVVTDNISGEGWSFDLQEQIPGLETNVSALNSGSLLEILKIANKRLQDKEDEIARLKPELENDKQSSEGNGDSVCQMSKDVSERITELEEDVLREEVSKTDQNSSAEKELLQAEILKVTEERAQLEVKLRDWESRGRSLEEEMDRLKVGIEKRGDDVEALNKDLEALKIKYEIVVTERDGLKATVEMAMEEVSCRDLRIEEMDEHLKRLHMEQVKLVMGAERGRKVVEELEKKVKKLEEEVERQRVAIANGAEEKREAIRQLCYSLDHYRNGYQQLRQAFIGRHKRFSVLAS
ncbi:hypothetical protein NE237_004105 [Protea cynaroides]|uniref:NAB domain-containing protein n=1 Tax=Protea cynaroides TaxID=273540 RepID=A0A9Q0KIB9_9MAGN|nr:hypothetical protein NE237_004105 [Protea cynaroides]